jgi:hypothetical protein
MKKLNQKNMTREDYLHKYMHQFSKDFDIKSIHEDYNFCCECGFIDNALYLNWDIDYCEEDFSVGGQNGTITEEEYKKIFGNGNGSVCDDCFFKLKNKKNN